MINHGNGDNVGRKGTAKQGEVSGGTKRGKGRRDVREGLERLGLSEDKWRGRRGLKMLGERQPCVIVRHSEVWWGLVGSN